MKLVINYDLINKINDANRGYSLIRATKRALIPTSMVIPLTFGLNMISSFPLNELPELMSSVFILESGIWGTLELSVSRLTCINSTNDLKRLVEILRNININTDYELLMESYAYHTDYEFNFKEDTLLPSIEQKKYIMVPVYDNGEESKLSILQEHTIGKKEYYLSVGEFKKVRKLVPSMA